MQGLSTIGRGGTITCIRTMEREEIYEFGGFSYIIISIVHEFLTLQSTIIHLLVLHR